MSTSVEAKVSLSKGFLIKGQDFWWFFFRLVLCFFPLSYHRKRQKKDIWKKTLCGENAKVISNSISEDLPKFSKWKRKSRGSTPVWMKTFHFPEHFCFQTTSKTSVKINFFRFSGPYFCPGDFFSVNKQLKVSCCQPQLLQWLLERLHHFVWNIVTAGFSHFHTL